MPLPISEGFPLEVLAAVINVWMSLLLCFHVRRNRKIPYRHV